MICIAAGPKLKLDTNDRTVTITLCPAVRKVRVDVFDGKPETRSETPEEEYNTKFYRWGISHPSN
jgi:hypothetical protein